MATGWHLVRVTLEARAPLSCGSGEAGADTDVMLVRDPNGLPMIPGSTIQGLLRTLHPQGAERDALFGREEAGGEGAAARLIFSHARVHGGRDEAAVFPARLEDPLLAALASDVPLRRDHVKLTDRHAAEEGKKFDRAAVPVGTRFSFEVLMRGDEGEKGTLLAALARLRHPFFRVGGRGRRGYGRVEAVAAAHGFFPPAKAAAFRALRATPLSNRAGLGKVTLADGEAVTVITLTLAPEGPWRTGGSVPAIVAEQMVRTGNGDRLVARQGPADAAPLREAMVRDASPGQRALAVPGAKPAEDYVLPGTSVAGPLRHRTVFHWNRLSGRLVDVAQPPSAEDFDRWKAGDGAVDRLFGWSRPVARAGKPDGRVSALLFDDLRFGPGHLLALDHVALDAFHGGARGRLLFDEELVAGGALELRIAVDARFMGREPEDERARQALSLAIRDLLKGRLAIGAKSYGFMTGSARVSGPDAAAWQALLDAACSPRVEAA